MVGIAGLYFVIADANRARFVRSGPDSLHTIEIVDSSTMRERGDDPATNPAVGSGSAPPPEEEHDRFARLLAARINNDFAVDLFTDLVLVAPPDVLRELASMLDAPTGASLIGSLAKDLVDVPDLELWPHLRSWVRPEEGA